MSSVGPVADWRKRRNGECIVCFDENNHRKHGVHFGDSTPKMVCPMCRKRFVKFARVEPKFKWNQYYADFKAGRIPPPLTLDLEVAADS